MSNIDEIIPVAKTVLESLKRIVALFVKGHYWEATKEMFNLFKVAYVNHLKGKYITLKGKKIPLTAVVGAAVIGLYMLYPAAEKTAVEAEKPKISEAEMVAQMNYYHYDDIIIDKMYKCQDSACGKLENTKDETIAEVVIPVAFFNKEGVLVYEGSVKASNVPALETIDFKVPAQVPFEYFKLGVVSVQ